MKRRQFVALASLLWSTTLGAFTAGTSQEDTNIYAGAVVWFQAFLRPLNQLGNAIDRNRFIAFLTQLGTAFEAMIQDKREIASLVTQTPPPTEDLKVIVERLRLNIGLSRQRIIKVAFMLKQQLKEQGDEIASNFGQVLLEKSWVRELQDDLRRGETSLARYDQKATDSAEALNKANLELAKAVAFISKA